MPPPPDATFPAGIPFPFPSDAPGAEELFDNPLPYHDFIEWSEIFWGQDDLEMMEDMPLNDEFYNATVAWYDHWLGFHIDANAQLDSFIEYLTEIGMTAEELMAAISAAFEKGGKSLDTLLESLSKWLFKHFGLSP